jgi:hypothetical protein
MRALDLLLATLRPRSAWGSTSPLPPACICACLLALSTNLAQSDSFVPTKLDPDPPSRRPATAPIEHPLSSDLDGLYFWIGPVGAASQVDGQWDSTIGGDMSVVYVREEAPVGAIGGSFGASRWTKRGGGRLWLDAVVGTNTGRMVGVSAGPILELSELAHPRLGASVGVWAFVGVTPFVRVGAVRELGSFVEVGLHIALPAVRRR